MGSDCGTDRTGAFALTLLALIVKGPKFKGKLKYRWNIPLVLAGFVLFAGVTQLALEKECCPIILET